MRTIFVITLLSFLNQPQATLTGADGQVLQFTDYNACQNALISRGLSNFQPFGVHGKCVQVQRLSSGQLRAVAPRRHH